MSLELRLKLDDNDTARCEVEWSEDLSGEPGRVHSLLSQLLRVLIQGGLDGAICTAVRLEATRHELGHTSLLMANHIGEALAGMRPGERGGPLVSPRAVFGNAPFPHPFHQRGDQNHPGGD